MAYPAKSIANELLSLAQSRGICDVTPMKLQKLVYYTHGWWFGATGEPLIEEQIEAWQYGPVVPSLYEATKKFGNQPIASPLHDYVLEGDDLVEVTQHVASDEQKAVENLLEWILDEYGDKSGIVLSNATHAEGGPWDTTVKTKTTADNVLPKSTDIDPEIIRSYFAAQIEKLAEPNQ